MRNLDYDKYYLKQDKRTEPKEIFKFMARKAGPFLDKFPSPSIGDIGCASGDFLYYLHSLYPSAVFTGLDYDEELLEVAKREIDFASFCRIDICDKTTLPPTTRFDALFMAGVHFYIDDLALWTSNFLSLLKPGGRGFVFGVFNPENLDILMKVKYPEKPGDYFTYGNLFSVYSVQKEFARLNAEVIMHEFEITIDVPRNPEDCLRSWTFKNESGNRIIVNGAQVIQTFMLAEIIPQGS